MHSDNVKRARRDFFKLAKLFRRGKSRSAIAKLGDQLGKAIFGS